MMLCSQITCKVEHVFVLSRRKAAVAGAFLYIAIVEIGLKELLVVRGDTDGHSHSAGFKSIESARLLMFLIGYTLMALLAIWL